MARVIEMKDRKIETVFTARDFEDLIEKYMGYECAKHYHEQITELSELIRELSLYVDDRDVTKDAEEVLKVNGY